MPTSVLTREQPPAQILEQLDFSPTTERPLDNLEKRLEADYDVFWEEFTNRVTFASPELEADEKMAGLQKDRDYFDLFVTGVRTMAERQPNSVITLLLDVDDNIGVIKEDDDKGIRVLVRPAFALAMEVLNSEFPGRIELGLLTSKPQGTLNSEAVHPTYLSALNKTIVNPFYFISSRDPERRQPWLKQLAGKSVINWDEPTLDPLLKEVAHVISIDKAKAMPNAASTGKEGELPAWYDAKLVIIDQLVRGLQMEPANHESTGQYKPSPLLKIVQKALNEPTERARAYIFMDDRPCASVIKDSPYLMGISTANLQQDVLTRAMIPGSGIMATAT